MTGADPRPVRLGADPLPSVGPASLTMGVFDGVHAGHRALLRATVSAARERGLRSVALVFDPHPDEVLKPGTRVPRLAPLATNLGRIEDEIGIDHAIPIRFDAELRALTAEEFLAALAPAIELRVIVMSPESAFGRGRGGTVDRLRELGRESGFGIVTVEPVTQGGVVISSRRVRDALAAGDVGQARGMGTAPALVGRAGATGTLTFGYLPALPASGTYRVSLRDARAPAREMRAVVAGDRVRLETDGGPQPADEELEVELLERL